MRGAKRVVAVDVAGLPVGALVVAASAHENRAGELMLAHLTQLGVTGRLELVLVDLWGHRGRCPHSAGTTISRCAGSGGTTSSRHIGRAVANLHQRDAERSCGVAASDLTSLLSWSKVSFIDHMNAWKDGRAAEARVSLDAGGHQVCGLAVARRGVHRRV